MASVRTGPGVLPQRQVRALGQGPRCRGPHHRRCDGAEFPRLRRPRTRPRPARPLRRAADARADPAAPPTAAAPSSSTPPSALAGTPSVSSPSSPDLRVIGLDRDPERPVDRRRAARAVRRPRHAGAHPLRRHRGRAGRNRLLGKQSGRHPVRPRGVVDATRPHRARLLLRRRRAAGHADGSRRGRSPPPRCSTPTTRRRWRGCCGSSARSGSPVASPPRSSAAARSRPFATTGELVELLYRGDPRAGPPHRRASGQAHLPGAAHRRQRRAGLAARRDCPRRSAHWRPAGESW